MPYVSVSVTKKNNKNAERSSETTSSIGHADNAKRKNAQISAIMQEKSFAIAI